MNKIIEALNPPATTRAWLYRIVFLAALIVVGLALLFGQDPAVIIATATSVSTIVIGALATVNTSLDGDSDQLPPPAPPK